MLIEQQKITKFKNETPLEILTKNTSVMKITLFIHVNFEPLFFKHKIELF